MEPKKQKKKNRYTLMVISDSAEGGIRQFFLGQGIIVGAAALALCLLAAGIAYLIFASVSLGDAVEANQALSTQVTELTEEKDQLEVRNTELEENVTLLSDTINEKVQKEEEDAQKSIPNGFPLAGAAAIQESSEVTPEDVQVQEEAEEAREGEAEEEEGQEQDQEKVAEDQTPIVVFVASAGTSVIVTGNGMVETIEADEEYGNRISVNHGNGYITVYRSPSPVKVKVGDEITKGTMLIEMTTENERLGYQMMKDGEYIDPLELMEIYG